MAITDPRQLPTHDQIRMMPGRHYSDLEQRGGDQEEEAEEGLTNKTSFPVSFSRCQDPGLFVSDFGDSSQEGNSHRIGRGDDSNFITSPYSFIDKGALQS